MRKRRILSAILSVLLILCMLPAAVFAEGAGQPLDGKLRLNAPASSGAVLRADYDKVTPEGMTDDCFSFQWYRKDGQEQTELGTDSSYTVSDQDLGYQIVLVVTGMEEFGISGTLTAVSNPVTASAQEAEALLQAQPDQYDVAYTAPDNAQLPADGEIPSGEEVYYGDIYSDDGEYYGGEIAVDGDESIGGEESGVDYSGDEMLFGEENMDEETGYEEGLSGEGQISGGEEMWPEESAVFPEGEIESQDENWDLGSENQPESEGSENGEIWNETEEVVWTQLEQDDPEGDQKLLDEAAGLEVPEPEADPEPEEETGPVLTVQTDREDHVLDFGVVSASDIAGTPMQYAKITNNGSETLYFSEIHPEHFMADDISVLEPGQTEEVFVQPREGLEPRTYTDTIVYTADNGETAQFQAQVEIQSGTLSGDEPVEVSVEPTSYAFPTVLENEDGTYTVPDAAVFQLTATGEIDFTSLEVVGPENSVFTASAVSDTGSFTIQPDSLTEADYEEDITETFTVMNTDMETPPTVTVSFRVDCRSPLISVIDPESAALDFGTLTVGYTAPSEEVVVKNTGNVPVTLTADGSDSFEVILPDDFELDPEEEAIVEIWLKEGLPVTETVTENVKIGTEDDTASVEVACSYAVEAAATPTPTVTPAPTATPVPEAEKLLKVYSAGEITGLPNGTDKSVTGLTLPSKVAIETTKGRKTAAVTWDVAASAYNPASVSSQTFVVNGWIILPDGVQQNNVSLATSAKVTVNAYSPYRPADADTYLTGISSSSYYTTDSEISFQVVGGGMNRDAVAREGDIQYVPSGWKVLDTRPFMDTTYKSTFRIKQAGDYTLTVTFDEKTYSANGQWDKTGKQISRSVNFHVAQGQTVTATPNPSVTGTESANKNATTQKSAVQTGDDTNILPFVVILILAILCIAGILVYRNKKK